MNDDTLMNDYEFLGLDPSTATPTDIERALQDRGKEIYDMYSTPSDDPVENDRRRAIKDTLTRRLTDATNHLYSPESKKEYDKTLDITTEKSEEEQPNYYTQKIKYGFSSPKQVELAFDPNNSPTTTNARVGYTSDPGFEDYEKQVKAKTLEEIKLIQSGGYGEGVQKAYYYNPESIEYLAFERASRSTWDETENTNGTYANNNKNSEVVTLKGDFGHVVLNNNPEKIQTEFTQPSIVKITKESDKGSTNNVNQTNQNASTLQTGDKQSTKEPLTQEQEKILNQLRRASNSESRVKTFGKLVDTYGLDAVVSTVIPEAGDAGSSVVSGLYLVVEGKVAGISKKSYLKIIALQAADFAIGAIPVVGDAADYFFKASKWSAKEFENKKNDLVNEARESGVPESEIAKIKGVASELPQIVEKPVESTNSKQQTAEKQTTQTDDNSGNNNSSNLKSEQQATSFTAKVEDFANRLPDIPIVKDYLIYKVQEQQAFSTLLTGKDSRTGEKLETTERISEFAKKEFESLKHATKSVAGILLVASGAESAEIAETLAKISGGEGEEMLIEKAPKFFSWAAKKTTDPEISSYLQRVSGGFEKLNANPEAKAAAKKLLSDWDIWEKVGIKVETKEGRDELRVGLNKAHNYLIIADGAEEIDETKVTEQQLEKHKIYDSPYDDPAVIDRANLITSKATKEMDRILKGERGNQAKLRAEQDYDAVYIEQLAKVSPDEWKDFVNTYPAKSEAYSNLSNGINGIREVLKGERITIEPQEEKFRPIYQGEAFVGVMPIVDKDTADVIRRHYYGNKTNTDADNITRLLEKHNLTSLTDKSPGDQIKSLRGKDYKQAYERLQQFNKEYSYFQMSPTNPYLSGKYNDELESIDRDIHVFGNKRTIFFKDPKYIDNIYEMEFLRQYGGIGGLPKFTGVTTNGYQIEDIKGKTLAQKRAEIFEKNGVEGFDSIKSWDRVPGIKNVRLLDKTRKINATQKEVNKLLTKDQAQQIIDQVVDVYNTTGQMLVFDARNVVIEDSGEVKLLYSYQKPEKGVLNDREKLNLSFIRLEQQYGKKGLQRPQSIISKRQEKKLGKEGLLLSNALISEESARKKRAYFEKLVKSKYVENPQAPNKFLYIKGDHITIGKEKSPNRQGFEYYVHNKYFAFPSVKSKRSNYTPQDLSTIKSSIAKSMRQGKLRFLRNRKENVAAGVAVIGSTKEAIRDAFRSMPTPTNILLHPRRTVASMKATSQRVANLAAKGVEKSAEWLGNAVVPVIGGFIAKNIAKPIANFIRDPIGMTKKAFKIAAAGIGALGALLVLFVIQIVVDLAFVIVAITILGLFILHIINSGAYIVPQSGNISTGPNATCYTGTCPVPDGTILCGSLGSGLGVCEHGTNEYWSTQSSECAWPLPASAGGRCSSNNIPGNVCYGSNPNCPEYGWAADVWLGGSCGTGTEVLFPSIGGNQLDWLQEFAYTGGLGQGGMYSAEDGTNVYELYIIHFENNTPASGTSGDFMGEIWCGYSSPHIHYELKINGNYVRPDDMCVGGTGGDNECTLPPGIVDCDQPGPYGPDYEPSGLVTFNKGGRAIQLLPDVAADLSNFFSQAASQGHTLVAYDGYRSYEYQHDLCEECNQNKANDPDYPCLAAPASQSIHRTGRAVDLYRSTLEDPWNIVCLTNCSSSDPMIQMGASNGFNHPYGLGDPPHFEHN